MLVAVSREFYSDYSHLFILSVKCVTTLFREFKESLKNGLVVSYKVCSSHSKYSKMRRLIRFLEKKHLCCFYKLCQIYSRHKFDNSSQKPYEYVELLINHQSNGLSIYSTYNSKRVQRRSARVQRSSVKVQRSSVMVQRSSVGSALACCLAGRVRISARHPREVFPSGQQAMKKMERGLGEWRWMNVLYERDYNCMKLQEKMNEKSGSSHQTFISLQENIFTDM
jgi:hypothetical protein